VPFGLGGCIPNCEIHGLEADVVLEDHDALIHCSIRWRGAGELGEGPRIAGKESWVRIGLLWSGRASLEEGSVSEIFWVQYRSQLALAVPFDGASSGGNPNVTSVPDEGTHNDCEGDRTRTSYFRG
jgi:hypothetical protein